MDYSILSKIKSPDDIKRLDNSQITALCDEIRSCIIKTVSNNGGHLASNLGTVELTVALHRVFNSPKDAIIFDVGHQCYAHKLLTGRFDRFSTLRQKDGISGFMKPTESPHDPVITGHSSSSISSAYGIYKAKQLLNEEGTAIAVIGDGALTGGLAYEALNNSGNQKSNFIVVLNDNEISISKNVGSLARALTKMRNKPRYHRFKSFLSRFLLKLPKGKFIYNKLSSFKDTVKAAIYKQNIFSSLGFNYLGPVDGHNVPALETIFKIAESYNKPSLVHVVTTKGKGYEFAENNPYNYHGVSSFDIEKGINCDKNCGFSNVVGRTLCNLALTDDKICAITAAMTEGTGLSEFAKNFKERFFDVGIAEEFAVTFAAGLATKGLKPFFVVYSSFLQRGYDQLIHDAAIANLPIKLLIDRAGIVGEDGETHQGLFDVSFLSSIPNISIYSPTTNNELVYRINQAADNNDFVAIRYPRGCENDCDSFDITADYHLINGCSDTLVVCYGRIFSEASIAKNSCPDINILKLNKIYPLNAEILEVLLKFKDIHFFEESEKSGGIAQKLASMLLENNFKGNYKIHAVLNQFVSAQDTRSALAQIGIDSNSIINAVRRS